ncbi:MAG TPA: hypothetical protein PLU94_02105 [Methanoregulaceae archaeon]|nr:hypothetical protein [Methanoregulaceae archaeon]
MTLKNRIYGHSLSAIEKELIFSREDTGFVRPIHSSGALFCLDPSPFLQSPKREVYLAQCPPPEKHALIRARVSEARQDIMKDRDGYYTLTVKYVDAWSPVDPNTLVSRRSTISADEVRHYFTIPYLGEEEIVDSLALCSALYTVSSPPLAEEKGGVCAAVLGKKKPWLGFKKSLAIIPREFRQLTSPYYYAIAEQEKQVLHTKAEEINLAYHNPERIPMHIPVVLDAVEVQPSKHYALDMESQSPMVTAFMLDALMIRPDIPASLESYVTDTLYAVVQEFKGSGWAPYQQDFSSLVPRLSLSFARYNAHLKLSRSDVTQAVDLWSDMYYRAKKVVSTQYHVSQLYRLDDTARKLYLDLVDAYGLEISIPLEEVRKQIPSFRSEGDFEEALDTLNRYGLLTKPRHDRIKILDNRSVKA